MEKKPKNVFTSRSFVYLLLCIWFQITVVESAEFGGPTWSDHKFSKESYTYDMAARKFQVRHVTMSYRWGSRAFSQHLSDNGHKMFRYSQRKLERRDGVAVLPPSVYDQSKPVAMNIWLYIGTSDPLCYAQVTFTEQFWEDYHPSTYCLKHMHEHGCTYIKNEMQNITNDEFLGTRRIVHCYGFEGHMHLIESGQRPDWVQLQVMQPALLSSFYGEFMFYVNLKGEYVWVSQDITIGAITYHDGRLTGMVTQDYHWGKINLVNFTLGISDSLLELLDKMVFYGDVSGYQDRWYASRVRTEECECNRIAQIFTPLYGNTYAGLTIKEKSKRGQYVIPTCQFSSFGNSVGECDIVPIESFVTSIHYDEVKYDDEQHWYMAILDALISKVEVLVTSMFSALLGSITKLLSMMGYEVLVGFLISYCLVVKKYGDIPALIVSLVVTTMVYYMTLD